MKKNNQQKWDNNDLEELFDAILKLKTKKQCRAFFRDLCTISELKAMSERFKVVKALFQGESYRSISKRTGLSTATITRIAHWFKYGEGGYKFILKKLKF